ncbi:MAG: phosphate-starvation-inducible PsiE family protein [Opitutales bacterium]
MSASDAPVESTSPPAPLSPWVLRLFNRAETLIYAIVSGFLILGAVVLIGDSAYKFFVEMRAHGVEHGVLRALEDLLLVIMLAEILHTVGYTLKHRTLACRPFLVVGVIAAVRRMLIITAELGSPSSANQEFFRLAMLELGILTATIVALCIGIYLLSRIQDGERAAA